MYPFGNRWAIFSASWAMEAASPEFLPHLHLSEDQFGGRCCRAPPQWLIAASTRRFERSRKASYIGTLFMASAMPYATKQHARSGSM